MQAYKFFTVEKHGDTTVAHAVDASLQGIAQAEFVKEELIQITQDTQKRLVIDFHKVRIISSSVIASLLVVKGRAASSGKRISLSMSDSLRGLFGTLNLDGTVFEIYSTTRQAITTSPRSESYFDICGQLSPPDEDFDLTVHG